MKLELKDLKVGQVVYVCDFRQPDLNKKPIRHVKPTSVYVVSNKDLPDNKKIYYWDKHFRVMNSKGTGYTSKVIAAYDNTGHRCFPGKPLNIFDNLDECVNHYVLQYTNIIHRMEQMRDDAASIWQDKIDNLYDDVKEVMYG